ncbi:MAG: amino acid transporter permease [Herminiimonas sp.]|nr:amino acid transporter permease [Herminiimonas sp.]
MWNHPVTVARGIAKTLQAGGCKRMSVRQTVLLLLAACLLLVAGTAPESLAADTLHVGSKRFTESYLLGEILTQTAAARGPVEHRQGLGNTAIVYAALLGGSIDIYAEYLGTVQSDILHHAAPLADLQKELAAKGLGLSVPLGFNNTYALAMRSADSKRLGIQRISDLASHPELRAGFSHEFLGRSDGWPGLVQQYRLPQKPDGLDHGVAYNALAAKQVDLIDVYSTDARIGRLGLQILQDDLHFFPNYDALLLYRLDLPQRFPAAWRALQKLEGRISVADMMAMNAAVEIDGRSFASVAKEFIAGKDAGASSERDKSGAAGFTSKPSAAPAPAGMGTATTSATSPGRTTLWQKLFDENLWRLTRQHVFLVGISVLVAALLGIPLGVLAASSATRQQVVMSAVGVLQTIPSLALLAMLIPLLGSIGTVPALVALVLYALLPIVRNTCIGLAEVPAGLRTAAMGLGLTRRQRMLYVELPLAAPVILAGLKTATVISVGTATIAAFIGAGGYGEKIAIGLALNDNQMLLAGAIPAAVLAILTQQLFELIETLVYRRRRAHAERQ